MKKHWIRNIIIGLIALAIVAVILKIAPDYTRTDITDKINLVINNNNVTSSLKKDIFVDDKGVVYVSKQDLANFFDRYIYYDEMYNQIITTSETKVASLVIDKKQMAVNGVNQSIAGTAIKQNDTYYLPFSEMENVYNIEIDYVKENNRVVVTSIDRKLVEANCTKNINVKWKEKILSRTIEKIKKDDKVVVISSSENGWSKIRTSLGNIGYVKTKDLTNITTIREQLQSTTRLEEKVSLVWDYYSEYVSAPDRTGEHINGINVVSPSFFMLTRLGKGEIYDNAGTGGKKYVEWAKSEGYKVWPIFSNNSMPETTHEILSDYKLRLKTIESILSLAKKYEVNGINLDFENMYEEDKDLFTRFVAELYPRLHEYGMPLSVDVTAPDGSPMWSLCFDRLDISRNCDYMVFMAYDEYNETKAGPNCGYDWIQTNLAKFERDNIDSSKIIIALPLYSRTWRAGYAEDEPYIVSMKNINSVVPESAVITWDDTLKQNKTEYVKNGYNYKMWIDDEKSTGVRIDLILEKNLRRGCFLVKR